MESSGNWYTTPFRLLVAIIFMRVEHHLTGTNPFCAGQVFGGGFVMRTVPGYPRKSAWPGAPGRGSIAEHPGRAMESSGES